jgi:thiol-disulfide isomerase/thioredoxin
MRLNPALIGAALALCALATTIGSGASDLRSRGREAPPVLSADSDAGADWIGRYAPEWSFDRWVRGSPRSLTSLRGKVVLLRWWTDQCPYCAATLPALEKASDHDAQNGLVVIGVFHPKPPRPVSNRHVLEVANRLGFSGPIAVDERWSTLERYWLDGHPERSWTSISFLIDREGIVRWVQGGGEYHPGNDPRHAQCANRYRELETAIAAALADRGPRR